MAEADTTGTGSFGGPANYRIRVRGAMNEVWKRRLPPGLTVESRPARSGERGFETTLKGPLEDEAELFGVLDSLYDWNLPLLELMKIEDPAWEPQPTQEPTPSGKE